MGFLSAYLLIEAATDDQTSDPNGSVTDDNASSGPTRRAPQQQEIPLAVVLGQPVLQIPQDLYIPPDALEVILDSFEGPLDLLLYLIRRQNLDILDIPVFEITKQYIGYIQTIQDLRFELAADYLLMAAMLAEIKSRMLLPRVVTEDGEEEDPRAELVRRLQEYERYKTAAEDLDKVPRQDRDTAVVQVGMPKRSTVQEPPSVDLRELILALQDVLKRAELFTEHAIKRETLSVRQRMTELLDRLQDGSFHRFETLFAVDEGKLGIVVSLLGLLTLAKEQLVDIVQDAPLAPIYVKSMSRTDAGTIELHSEFDDEPESGSI